MQWTVLLVARKHFTTLACSLITVKHILSFTLSLCHLDILEHVTLHISAHSH